MRPNRVESRTTPPQQRNHDNGYIEAIEQRLCCPRSSPCIKLNAATMAILHVVHVRGMYYVADTD